LASAGKSKLARIAIIAITTRSSIKVKALLNRVFIIKSGVKNLEDRLPDADLNIENCQRDD